MKETKAISLDTTIIKNIQEMAQKENRSFSNMIEIIIKNFMNKEK